MFQPKVHHHSRNPGEELYGERLEPDDIIDEGTDVYEGSNGKWLSL